MSSNDEAAATAAPKAGDATETLPPLSAADFRVYNRLADKMELFVSIPFVSVLCFHCRQAV